MSTATTAGRPSSDAAPTAGSGFATLLGPGTAFEGLLTFRGRARVDGALTGQVRAAGTLVLGPTARVEATVEVDELILAGELRGDVVARTRVVLERGARLHGSLRAPVLRVEAGAVLDGPCRTGPGATAGAGSAAATKPSTAAETAGNAPESA